MADRRTPEREPEHTTETAGTPAQDDLRPESRQRDADRGDSRPQRKDDPGVAPESGDRKGTG